MSSYWTWFEEGSIKKGIAAMIDRKIWKEFGLQMGVAECYCLYQVVLGERAAGMSCVNQLREGEATSFSAEDRLRGSNDLSDQQGFELFSTFLAAINWLVTKTGLALR